VIAAKDHASVQLNIGEIDDTGRFTGSFKTYALCGNLRQMGEADDSLTKICIDCHRCMNVKGFIYRL